LRGRELLDASPPTTFMSTSAFESSMYGKSSTTSPLTTPTETAATGGLSALVSASLPVATSLRIASATATHAPVIDETRVPPSADSTSQSTAIVRSPSLSRSTAARSDRPISRWISLPRPPGSRLLRVCVDRGSIAYSAVSQPLPLPAMKPGTPSSTLAAHSTQVSPSLISAEPSACFW